MTRLAILISTLLAASGAQAQKAGATVTEPHKEKMLKEIAQYATPDQHHKALDALVGKFNTLSKLWFGEPKPEQATGHAQVGWVLGGRFVEEHYDTVIWGKPFAAQGVLGYDERESKYVIAWLDSWGTWVTVAEGDADTTGHTMTMTTRDYDNPAGKTRPVKFVISIDGNDHHVRRVYEKLKGVETMTMEIEYKRTK